MKAIPLPPPGSRAHEVLIEALSQYVANQREYVGDVDDAPPTEVDNLRVAELILGYLEASLVKAVGA
jgi:hypothetical protein